MRLLKQALGVLGALLAVVAVTALVMPKAVHAVAAALVEVTNTSTNPVPMYDSSTRFQADLCHTFGSVSAAENYCGTNTSRSFVVPSVTSGGAAVKRLVVDNVAGVCSSFNNPSFVITNVALTGQFVPDSVANGDSSATHWIPLVGPAHSYVNDPSIGPPLGGFQETDYGYGQNAHFSFNPGTTVSAFIEYSWTGVGDTDAGCLVNVEGYLATQ
jgi:hypothetical protein